jgi:hypothetical protein
MNKDPETARRRRDYNMKKPTIKGVTIATALRNSSDALG